MKTKLVFTRFITLLLSLALLVSAVPFASASNADTFENAKIVDYIVENPSIRGVNQPTTEWDWDDGPYWGSFSGVQFGVYTNYYFTGVDSLEVTFTNLSTDEVNIFIFTIIDLTDSSETYDVVEKHLPAATNNASAFNTYIGLDTTHRYCVRLRSSAGPISGRLRVRSI